MSKFIGRGGSSSIMLVMEEGMMDSVDLMLRCQKGAREHIMVEWTVELVLWQYSPNMVKGQATVQEGQEKKVSCRINFQKQTQNHLHNHRNILISQIVPKRNSWSAGSSPRCRTGSPPRPGPSSPGRRRRQTQSGRHLSSPSRVTQAAAIPCSMLE